MKKQLLMLAGLMLCLTSFSQVRVGIGLQGALPQSDFGDAYQFGGGAYLEPKVSFNNVEVALNLGGMLFLPESLELGDLDPALIVNTTVVGYYFLSTPGVKPYFGIGLGPYFTTIYSIEVNPSDPANPESHKSKSTEFGFMPKIGINASSFDLGVSYHLAGDIKFLAVNLGFNISKRA